MQHFIAAKEKLNSPARKCFELLHNIVRRDCAKHDGWSYTITEVLMIKKNRRIILLNGPSSSGKSSLAYSLKTLLEQKHLNYQVVSIDDFMKLRTDEKIYEDDVFEISSDMCDKTIEYLETSDGVIIDHVITSERIFEQLLDRTNDYEMIKVHVTCPLEELLKRENKRGNRCIGSAEASYQYLYPEDGYDIEVNTFKHSTEECAIIVIDKLLL